jgi:hypothetical protein
MGSSTSSNSYENYDSEWEIAKKQAIRNYNYRLRNYNPLLHGPHDIYLLEISADYELECLPRYVRSRIRD